MIGPIQSFDLGDAALVVVPHADENDFDVEQISLPSLRAIERPALREGTIRRCSVALS